MGFTENMHITNPNPLTLTLTMRALRVRVTIILYGVTKALPSFYTA
jgi:hypothetical protein